MSWRFHHFLTAAVFCEDVMKCRLNLLGGTSLRISQFEVLADCFSNLIMLFPEWQSLHSKRWCNSPAQQIAGVFTSLSNMFRLRGYSFGSSSCNLVWNRVGWGVMKWLGLASVRTNQERISWRRFTSKRMIRMMITGDIKLKFLSYLKLYSC